MYDQKQPEVVRLGLSDCAIRNVVILVGISILLIFTPREHNLKLTNKSYTVNGPTSEHNSASFFGVLTFDTSNINPNTFCRVVMPARCQTADEALSKMSDYHIGNTYPVSIGSSGECSIVDPNRESVLDMWEDIIED